MTESSQRHPDAGILSDSGSVSEWDLNLNPKPTLLPVRASFSIRRRMAKGPSDVFGQPLSRRFGKIGQGSRGSKKVRLVN